MIDKGNCIHINSRVTKGQSAKDALRSSALVPSFEKKIGFDFVAQMFRPKMYIKSQTGQMSQWIDCKRQSKAF